VKARFSLKVLFVIFVTAMRESLLSMCKFSGPRFSNFAISIHSNLFRFSDFWFRISFGLRPSVFGFPALPVALVLTFCVASTGAANWPRLGGPGCTWISPETNLARSWPIEGPRVLWSIDVAEGFAGAAVYDGQVFLLDRVGNQQDVLRCLALNTGRELWRLPYDAPGTLPYNGSRNVPTVDDQYVFTVGPFGHLRCVDRKRHQLVWARHLVDDFKEAGIDTQEPPKTREETLARAQVPMWGLTQAPLLYRDTVIVAPQTRRTGLVAYERSTGKIRWTSNYIGRNWYSHVSPYLTSLCGVDQVIMMAQPSDPEKSPPDAPPAIISSIDPQSGRILWTNQTPAPDKIPIAQPVRIAPDTLFISSGFGLGCLALQVSHAGDGWQTRLAFHTRAVAAFIHSPIFYRDRIYMTSFKEHRGTHTGLVCLRSDGELVWQTGPELQFDSGAYLIADGMVFIMNGKTGELFLFELSDSGPRLLAKSKVLGAKGGNVWAPMALSDGKLIVRDQHEMKCLEVN
jgi:outer membrane protein assembly factor BamB